MGISFGSLGIPIPSILRIFVHELFGVQFGTIDSIDRNIMMNIRLPRIILAALVGAALALSGAAFQGLLKILLLTLIRWGYLKGHQLEP